MDKLLQIWHSSGIYQLELGQAVMMAVGLILLYLAIRKTLNLCCWCQLALVAC